MISLARAGEAGLMLKGALKGAGQIEAAGAFVFVFFDGADLARRFENNFFDDFVYFWFCICDG